MFESLTEEEILAAEKERKANLVGHEEFRILTSRVDVMDESIGKIVSRVSCFEFGKHASWHLSYFGFIFLKIESVLSQLESIERQKLKRRENMTSILEKLNEAQNSQSEMKRSQLQKIVKEELEKWDEPISPSRMDEFEERDSSIRVSSAAQVMVPKKPWFHQN